MKKRNLFAQTAVASAMVAMSLGANAAISNATGTTFAAEIFGTGSDAVTLINASSALNPTFTMGVDRTVAASTFQVKYTLANAVFQTAATSGSVTIGGNCAANTACTGTISVRSGGAAGDSSVTFDVTPTTNPFVTGNTTLTLVVPNLKGASALGTAGAKIQATIALSDLYGALDTSGNHTATLATSAAGLSATATAATGTTAAPYSGTIDAISQSSKYFTNGSTANSATVSLGTVAFAGTTNGMAADGTTTLSTSSSDTIAVTLSGDFSAAVGVANKMGVFLSTNAANCTTVSAIAATTLTATSVTFANVAGNTTNTAVCMTVDGATAIVPTTPSLTASYTPATTTSKTLNITSTNLLPLALNVTQKDVRHYIPAAVTNYSQVIKLINTGSTATQFNVALISEATGTVGTAVPIGASIPVRGALRLSQGDIETAIGTQSGTVRPRLRFTAATSSFDVQSFVNTPNGAYSNITGAE